MISPYGEKILFAMEVAKDELIVGGINSFKTEKISVLC